MKIARANGWRAATFILFFCTTGALAQGAGVSLEAVLKAPTLAAYSPAAFSPDGKLLAYVVTDNARRTDAVDDSDYYRTGVGWYGVASDIWIADVTTGRSRNVTGGVANNWSVSWSPDGSRLAFLSDRGSNAKPVGPARLWIWDRAADKLRQASEADVREGFAPISWTADGRSVLVTTFPEGVSPEVFAARMKGLSTDTKQEPGTATAKVFEYDPKGTAAAVADQINLDIWARDLALIDVESGKLTRVSSGLRVGAFVTSPDRRKLAYSVLTQSEKTGSGQYLYDLVVHDLASGNKRTVASGVRLTLIANSLALSPNGDRLAYRTGGPLAQDEVFVVSTSGGEPQRIAQNPATDTLAFDVSPPVWSADGRDVFFVRKGALWRAAADGSRAAAALAGGEPRELELVAPRQGLLLSPDRGRTAVLLTEDPATKKVGFARVDLTSGAITQIIEEDKRYGGYDVEPAISPDGKSVAFIAEDAARPPDYWLLTLDQPARPARKLSNVAPALASSPTGRARLLEWRTLDGQTVRGALVYPANYEAGKKYPLIVKVYGGSSISNDLNRFGYSIAPYENLHIYTSRGYAILIADSKLNVGTPMVDLMKSVMPGVNAAIDSGVADPERLGITGHSYGGYSTLSLIAQSKRFKAAVMRAGMGNLFSGYGQLSPDGTNYGLNWSESGQGRMGGSPWEFRERYFENSPIFFLDRVETPLLIIHGEKDDAVPVYLADEVFTALRRLGKAVTYVRYAGENHWEGGWSYANQVDALTRTLAWYEKHLKP